MISLGISLICDELKAMPRRVDDGR